MNRQLLKATDIVVITHLIDTITHLKDSITERFPLDKTETLSECEAFWNAAVVCGRLQAAQEVLVETRKEWGA